MFNSKLTSAEKCSLFINRFSRVVFDKTKKPHRLLAELSGHPTHEDGNDIIIRHAVSSDYTCRYRELTREFHLSF